MNGSKGEPPKIRLLSNMAFSRFFCFGALWSRGRLLPSKPHIFMCGALKPENANGGGGGCKSPCPSGGGVQTSFQVTPFTDYFFRFWAFRSGIHSTICTFLGEKSVVHRPLAFSGQTIPTLSCNCSFELCHSKCCLVPDRGSARVTTQARVTSSRT